MTLRMLLPLAGLLMGLSAPAQTPDFPRMWKWISDREVAFSYSGTFTDSLDFAVDAKTLEQRRVCLPAKRALVPTWPEDVENRTYSPDSTMLAYTRSNDLYVLRLSDSLETRLTFDGSDLVLNGYASWVYYEEIFGRPSRYRAFWWAPDSKKIAFYRFDNTRVPMFPIYSPKGQDGSLRQTRYPKCGEPNPEVRIGIVSLGAEDDVVWADFDPSQDQYFGTPFWGDDSETLYVSREPRVQNTLDLYAVSAIDGSKKAIYHEEYDTWLDWISGMVFTSDGLYMVRSFETGWEQIYFLSYDGTVRRITDGDNWRTNILAVNEKNGDVFFTAERGQHVRQALYKVDRKGVVTAITDPSHNAARVALSPDCAYYVADISNAAMPDQIWIGSTSKPFSKAYKIADMAEPSAPAGSAPGQSTPSQGTPGQGAPPQSGAPPQGLPGGAKPALDDWQPVPELIYMTTSDGFELPALIVYPKDFDPSRKYPVHVDIYGGPDTPMVSDRYGRQDSWFGEHGIIQVTADCRAAGHNGRAGLDMIYEHLSDLETRDFVEWAEYLKSLPYVNGDKIGVEGFSFGGTMTARLVMQHSDAFHYGIAGGGVYDWSLYDTHYTERFMNTPENNPEGYATTRVVGMTADYPTVYTPDDEEAAAAIEPVMLKLTHGTGDDNVHFQNTLQLIDALQEGGKKFEFMIYPDGMHGYRGYQGRHFNDANCSFWLKYLLSE